MSSTTATFLYRIKFSILTALIAVNSRTPNPHHSHLPRIPVYLSFANIVSSPLSSKPSSFSSEQPNVNKQPPHHHKKQHPHPPPHSRLLRHPQHPPHRALQLPTRPLKLHINRLGKTTRLANLITDRDGEVFQLADFRGEDRGLAVCVCRGLVLGFEMFEDGGGGVRVGFVVGW